MRRRTPVAGDIGEPVRHIEFFFDREAMLTAFPPERAPEVDPATDEHFWVRKARS